MTQRYFSWDLLMQFAFLASAIFIFFMTFKTVSAETEALDDRADGFSQNILLALTDDNAEDLALLTQFYIERDMEPIWVGVEGPTERAHGVLRILEAATYDGLDPEDYDISVIRRLMAASSSEELTELDLRLSISLMQFLSDLGSGRTEPSTLNPLLFVYPHDIDKAEVIKAAAEAEDIGVFVGGYRPRQGDYWRLKGVLANYRAMARAGGWPMIDPGPTMRPGDQSLRIAQLRARLVRSGDLARPEGIRTALESERFDLKLAEAVKVFQARHGLKQDGHVGPNTLLALNTPIEERIEQLVLSLERRRWMPDHLAARYIQVNLADFHLQLIDRGKIAFETPVVIGSQYNKTPVFSADMTYLVINPFWNVPQSIASREILQKARRDPGYFRRNGFDLFENWSEGAAKLDPMKINWHSVDPDRFSYKLRQRPGPKNALGRLKFMLPNDYSIYLHDTPYRTLFSASQRSFSHGCVRVADPEGLANAILAGQPGWTFEEIVEVVERGERKQVNLEKPLPVQITYLTAWVDKDNRVHFRNDVYDRDQILADALTKNQKQRDLFVEDASTEAHLDAIRLQLKEATSAQ